MKRHPFSGSTLVFIQKQEEGISLYLKLKKKNSQEE